jgi:hydroxymethylbilane synthase
MPREEIVVGSRDSELALTQADYVIAAMQKRFPDVAFTLKKIKTEGDKILDVALAKIGGKGLFVKEIENALLAGEIDLAVHSMKDVPTVIPPGLVIAAVTEREDARDCFIARDGKTGLMKLREGAVVGTSSLRRSAQLLALRPDLQIVPLRGNLQTRFRKLREMALDGIILAYAGVSRLGWADRVVEIISLNQSLPAAGQGALGIETRLDDERTNRVAAFLDNEAARVAVTAERALLRRLEGGCQVPIGAYARLMDGMLVLDGKVSSLDGKRVVQGQLCGKPDEAAAVGEQLAEVLLRQGAAEILCQVRQEFENHA